MEEIINLRSKWIKERGTILGFYAWYFYGRFGKTPPRLQVHGHAGEIKGGGK